MHVYVYVYACWKKESDIGVNGEDCFPFCSIYYIFLVLCCDGGLFYVYAALMYVYALCWALGIRQSAFFSPLPENIQYNTKSTINRLYLQIKVPTRNFLPEPHSNHRPTKKGWQH